ncbi:MAG: hypothetical protein DMG24_04880 [Acidobacteria bacterium]|nr:MAG: hypothetical protein DMG24_04880 [Acidobacteriota bacterium]
MCYRGTVSLEVTYEVSCQTALVALIKLKNILFATDFSPASLTALPYAAALARRYASKIYLAHIIMPEAYPLHALELSSPAKLDQQVQRQREDL